MTMPPRAVWLTSLFGLALLVRLAFVLWFGPDGLSVSDDAKAYHDLAVNLVEQHRYVTNIDPPHRLDLAYATRPPLTPFTLAAFYATFGPNLLVGQLVFAFAGAISTLLLYALGRQLFSEPVGLLAGFLAALYPFFAFLPATPLTENLAIPLYTALALLLTRIAVSPSFLNTLLGGCCLGLAALNRPQLLGFFPLLLFWAWSIPEASAAQRARTLLVVLAAAALVIAPWTIRNYLAVHRWVPISLQFGGALLQGNNPYVGAALEKIERGARGWYNDSRMGERLTASLPVDTDRQAARLALDFMRRQPKAALGYAVRKFRIFWSAYDHPVHRASWYPVFGLGLLGFVTSVRRWRSLLPIYLLLAETALIAVVFISLPRYRAPIEPFFLLMAAVALTELWKRRDRFTGRSRPLQMA